MIINYLDEKGENVVSPKLHLGEEEEEKRPDSELLYQFKGVLS